jgi:hypothetical protein
MKVRFEHWSMGFGLEYGPCLLSALGLGAGLTFNHIRI